MPATVIRRPERFLNVRLMWRAKVPLTAFRAYFSSVWDHDHGRVIAAAGSRRNLAHMFRYAAFPIPSGLPNSFTVWRGTNQTGFEPARKGYSWTTGRDVACWFAMRGAGADSAIVLSATVNKADIVMFHDARCEREVVLVRPPVDVCIDGTPNDWRKGYERYENSTNDAQHKRLMATQIQGE